METRRTFHEELDRVRADIVRLAALVTETIPRGTDVLLTMDLQEAQQLIEDDDILDALTLEIEEHCYQLLVLQAPVAADLRFLVAALRLTSEIERSGDLMVNIAKATRRLYGESLDPRIRGLIEQMSEEAVRLFRLAIDAYAEGNAGLAAAIDDMDDHLDDLHREYIEAIFEFHRREGIDLEAGVQLALVGRYYERIGDHAVNIAERVQYMVTGWLPEHSGAARAEARARKVPATAPGGDAEVVDGPAGGRPELRLAQTPGDDAVSGTDVEAGP
jgi:phosphate transport system protein